MTRPARAEADRRTTALLPSSIELLKNLGIWQGCEDQSAALEGVRIIDDRGGLLRAPEILFKAQELGLPSFGSNVANTVLNAALHSRACAAEGLRWLPTSAVAKVEPGQELVTIELAEGDASGFYRVAERLIRPIVRRNIAGAYRRLKHLLES